ncbi:MAG: hypothetical protein C4519_01805 [Desulfobacteraceae bacterium]|nr:MAG: hypothetical protein C4519_01805 [Desulfobacteraceae bacterium]
MSAGMAAYGHHRTLVHRSAIAGWRSGGTGIGGRMVHRTCRKPDLHLWLVLVLVAAVSACTTKVDDSETVARNGLVYRKGSDLPFSGIVAGTSRSEGYRNQTCRFKKEYKNGLLEGRSYFYYLNGKVESIEPYQKGVLNGVVTRYYESGQIKARLHFVDGMRGGAKGEMFWKEDGSKERG